MADIEISATAAHLQQLDTVLSKEKLLADDTRRAENTARMESEDYSKILRRVRDNRNLQRNIDALRFDDVERLHNQRLEADLRRLPLNEFDASDIPEDLPRRSIVDILA